MVKGPDDALDHVEDTVKVMEARDGRWPVRAGRHIRLFLRRWGRYLDRAAVGLAIGLWVLSAIDAANAREDIQQEGEMRSAQVCELFNSDHAGDIRTVAREQRRLRQTMRYLRTEATRPLSGIDLAIQRNVGQVRLDVNTARQEVIDDEPPPFCAEYAPNKPSAKS